MNQFRVYRLLVVVSCLLYVAWYFFVDYQTSPYPEVKKLLSLDGYAAIISTQSWILNIGVFWLWLIASIGLFCQ